MSSVDSVSSGASAVVGAADVADAPAAGEPEVVDDSVVVEAAIEFPLEFRAPFICLASTPGMSHILRRGVSKSAIIRELHLQRERRATNLKKLKSFW